MGNMRHQHYGNMNNPKSQCGKLWEIFLSEKPFGELFSSPYLAKKVGSLSIASVISGLNAQLGGDIRIKNELKVKYKDGERKVKSFFKVVMP